MSVRPTLYLLCLFFPLFGISQSYNYSRYSEKDGLKNRFIYTIDQDSRGYLMIGTGEGLYAYNGFDFEEFTTSSGLISNFITCSYREREDVIWYGHDNGSITKYSSNGFDTLNLSHYTHSRINQILIYDDVLWVLSQNDGLLKRGKDGKWSQLFNGLEEFTLYSFAIDKFGRIWLGTDIGLLLINDSTHPKSYEYIDDIIETKVSSIIYDDNRLLIGTEDLGIFAIDFINESYSVAPVEFNGMDFSSYWINSMFKSASGNLWVCSNNKGLLQLSAFTDGRYRKMKEHRDQKTISSFSIKTCAEDAEGNLWVGTIGDGLVKIQESFMTFFSSDDIQFNSVNSIYEKNDTIWSGEYGIIYVSYESPDNIIRVIDKKNGLPSDDITSISLDHAGALWIGTNDNGLFKLNPGSDKVKKITLPDGAELLRISDILSYNNTIYVATNYGVYQFIKDKLISHITIQSGLSVNSIKALYADVKGNIWFGTTTNQIAYIEEGEIKSIDCGLEGAVSQVKCIAEDNSGNIWIGTDGLGVICLAGDSIRIIDKEDGIYSDYCYSLICDQRNNLWVGHHGAVSKINLRNWKVEVINPGNQFDVDFVDNAVYRAGNGSVLFGTNKGVLRYDPEADLKNEVEPNLQMLAIFINDSLANKSTELKLPYGKYNIRFEFIGVSLKNAPGVKYQYYLEGYDNDWLPLTSSNEAGYNKLSPGNYTFHLRCYNGDGYGGITHITIRVFVDKPFWQKWWFIASAILMALILLRYIINRREQILIEDQKRLKKALDERTKEVVEQKELLEIKNKDITDSILYAKNIQQAMLPSSQELSRHFSDSFVFFKPRDIVSGDFYWVEQYGDIIVVACADCTGHGVPGAFMSLIGSTLLKDIAGYSDVKSSAEVLTYLDRELRAILHNQDDNTALQDGMDISVFDYNIKDKVLRVASANRPVFLYQNDQLIEIKGDRESIGGELSKGGKQFTLHEFHVQSGDTVYMFSDGITDQFGGESGKKLKRSGLKLWLSKLLRKDMKQQAKAIDSKFEQWKGENPQTDDVIFLGVRF